MTPLGRSITDRARPSEPAFIPDPPRARHIGSALLLILITSWLAAVAVIWVGCLFAGVCS